MDLIKDDDGTWRYTCSRPFGCGADGVPFNSSGWPSKAIATARGEQHEAEHEKGEPMPSLEEFRTAHKVEI
ncbi:MAG: DUF4192 domain-containing protein [Chloroflexi bacterium]|nr:DUF4192 domain-containing protein [Chloroflexota bacterium]